MQRMSSVLSLYHPEKLFFSLLFSTSLQRTFSTLANWQIEQSRADKIERTICSTLTAYIWGQITIAGPANFVFFLFLFFFALAHPICTRYVHTKRCNRFYFGTVSKPLHSSWFQLFLRRELRTVFSDQGRTIALFISLLMLVSIPVCLLRVRNLASVKARDRFRAENGMHLRTL